MVDGGDRLLDDHMGSGREGIHRQPEVGLRRSCDVDDVRTDRVQHGPMIGEPGVDAKPFGGGFRHGTRQVANPRQVNLRERAQAGQVLLSDLSSSNQCGFHSEGFDVTSVWL